jgi:hypothetical protein
MLLGIHESECASDSPGPLKFLGFLSMLSPPTDWKGFKGILPQLDDVRFTTSERRFWKIADVLFRISSMTNSFRYTPHPYSLVPDPQISRNGVPTLQFSTGPSNFQKSWDLFRPCLTSVRWTKSWKTRNHEFKPVWHEVSWVHASVGRSFNHLCHPGRRWVTVAEDEQTNFWTKHGTKNHTVKKLVRTGTCLGVTKNHTVKKLVRTGTCLGVTSLPRGKDSEVAASRWSGINGCERRAPNQHKQE